MTSASNNNNNNGGGFTFDFIIPPTKEDAQQQQEEGNNEAITTFQSTSSSGVDDDDDFGIISSATTITKQQEKERQHRRSFGWIDPNLLQEILTQQCNLYQSGKLMHDEIPLYPTTTTATTTTTTPATTTTYTAAFSSSLSMLRCIRGSSRLLKLQDSSTASLVADNNDYYQEKINSDNNNNNIPKKQHHQQRQQHQETDLITGVYEGGLTVWECSLDLVRFLHTTYHNNNNNTDTTTAPLSILELGCGHGLPTCYLLKRHYMLEMLQRKGNTYCHGNHHHVVLSDYNDYVLKDVTLTNLFLNAIVNDEESYNKQNNKDNDDDDDDDDIRSANKPSLVTPSDGAAAAKGTSAVEAAADLLKYLLASSQIQLGAGDWMGLSEQLRENQETSNNNNMNQEPKQQDLYTKFNIILASETLYTMQSAAETSLLLQRHLQHNTGFAYIATKRYYFGLGGGVDAFQQHVTLFNNNHNRIMCNMRMVVTTLQVHDNGSGNIRELLQVQILSQ